MHRSKLIIWSGVGLAAVIIIWQVGFHTSRTDNAASQTTPKPESIPNPAPAGNENLGRSGEPNMPAAIAAAGPGADQATEPPSQAMASPEPVPEPSPPAEANRPTPQDQRLDQAVVNAESETPQPRDEGGEAVNLKDVEMRFIMQKIAEWTGKVVIPCDEIMKEKITIYSPGRLSRSEALEQIYGALRIKGYTAEHSEKTIYLRPIRDARVGTVPTIAADQPLAAIENREQIVQKFFRLTHYDPGQMAQIVQPLIGEYGHLSADETTATLLVIDTVANLMRIETIISQFDTLESEQVMTQVFELRHRTPGEVIQLLQALLADSLRRGPGGPGRPAAQTPTPPAGGPARPNRAGGAGAASSVLIGTAQRPMLLIPEPKFNWIIAKAGPEDMNEIGRWIERLDRPAPTVATAESLDTIENKNQMVQRLIRLQHCEAGRMCDLIVPLIGSTGYVTVEDRTRTLLLVDTVDNLMRIEAVVAQFDVPEPNDMVTQVFELQHRDPEEIAALIEAVVGANTAAGTGQGPRNIQRRGNQPGGVRVIRSRPAAPVMTQGTGQPMLVIPEPNRKWIIVRATPQDMETIAGWIKRLDKPAPIVTADQPLTEFENGNQIVQRFITLEHYDPVRMSDIVTPLLTASGHVTAEESTGTLLLIDTAENLVRIEAVIDQFDVPETEHTTTQIFQVRQRSPEEVITLLQTILSNGVTGPGNAGRPGQAAARRPGAAQASFRSSAGGTSSIVTGAGGRSVTLVPEPRQGWIIAKGSPDDMAEVGRWIERLDQAVMTVTTDVPLATIENKTQIVQKCVKLRSYSASRMGEIVLPLLSESGYVSADESTGNLLLIDTVENLIRVEAIISEFDVPEAEQTVTQVFEIRSADPSEVVQLLRMLLSDGSGRGGAAGGRPGLMSRGGTAGSRLYRSGLSGATATAVVMGPSELPVILIPEPKRKWIIARASAEDMTLVSDWIAKLDRAEPEGREYETVPITYADVREVAARLNEALQQMPGTELQARVLVQALEQARQVMIFGRQDLREMIKRLIQEIDVPPGQFEIKHFELQYADPDQIKRNIDELYGAGAMTGGSYNAARYTGLRPGVLSPETVRVISHVSLKQVTVTASPENMKKIAEQIPQWDVAVDVNEIKPRIIELHNSDPTQMASLLSTLFSEEMSGQYAYYDYLLGSGGENRRRIIGPLYGQLTFEQVPGTKKLIVISNVAGAYAVVEELIQKLDAQEGAEVPKVVKLSYADPESLAERLNAMFNEPGTSVAIRLSERGLSDYTMDDTGGAANGANRNAPSVNRTGETGQEYRPWWTTGRRDLDTLPISNIIGRVRFIPDTHSKSLLVLSPPEFLDDIDAMIAELDVPGKQVMIKAIIMQVDHQSMTSLGVQVSSDPTKWETLDNENAVVARNTLSLLEEHGSLIVSPSGIPTAGTGTLISVDASVNVLVDFLIRELDAKILNQQTLWTKDNEEAEFFKGQRVGFQTRVSISDTGGRATSDFEYEKVGMTLRARPSVTPENNVDMIVNVILSQITSETINNQRVRTELDTTTNMVVRDGQTIMLGGMLFQEDSRVKRKIPLLGDIPLVGGLFQHNQNAAANSELLIFITPLVIDMPDKMLPEAAEELEQAKKKLDDVREQLTPPTPDQE